MITSSSSPIQKNWSFQLEPDHHQQSVRPTTTATVSELNEELAHWTVPHLSGFRAELALAVLSLVEAGGGPWSITHDEPTVALLRLSARIGLRQSDVATVAAAQVIDLLRLNRLSRV